MHQSAKVKENTSMSAKTGTHIEKLEAFKHNKSAENLLLIFSMFGFALPRFDGTLGQIPVMFDRVYGQHLELKGIRLCTSQFCSAPATSSPTPERNYFLINVLSFFSLLQHY
jgi:hypothetical protein